MEQWDIYDQNRIKTGKTMERGSAVPAGAYHMIVHVCIFNQKGEMLIQQRQPFKKGWSNLWDVSVGGSAAAGETSQLAAQREVLEEIGLSLDLSNTRPCFTMNFALGFDDYYIVSQDVAIESLKLQYEEVQGVKWATKDEILTMISEGLFIPYHKPLIELLFELSAGKQGAHSR